MSAGHKTESALVFWSPMVSEGGSAAVRVTVCYEFSEVKGQATGGNTEPSGKEVPDTGYTHGVETWRQPVLLPLIMSEQEASKAKVASTAPKQVL